VHQLAYLPVSAVGAAPGDELLGRLVAGRFTVLERLGAGSMGSVYRARQEAVGRDVALKVVRPDRALDAQARVRFEREARATSSLSSPHTVTVFDFGEAENGDWFLAMELLRGESLGQRLRRNGKMTPAEALLIAQHALTSLEEAHEKGIVHRDLKPDNLFLVQGTPDASATVQVMCKVVDFGIAKLHPDMAPMDAIETQAGAVFGTPRYMSPEQAQGHPLDARSDLYSLALIVYHMLTGRPPFTEDDAVVVMAAHIRSQPRPLVELVPELEQYPRVEALVMRGLSKRPDERPSSAAEFRQLLQDAFDEDLHSRSLLARLGAGLRGLWVRRRQRLMWGGAALALLLAVVGALLVGRLRVRDVPSLRGETPRVAARLGRAALVLAQSTSPVPSSSGGGGPAAVSVGGDTASSGPMTAQSAAPLAPEKSTVGVVRSPVRPRAKPTPASPTAPRKLPDDRYGRFE
jgi:tRNA A-37 threonylcarbamoyl transferase component Bud32